MTVVTSEFVIEGTETKSLTGITDKDGIIILPPSNEGVTDKDGKTDISETIPGKDTDGDGKEDTEESKTEYNINVEDTKGKIENSYIEIKDGKITVTLPDTHTLTTSNQTLSLIHISEPTRRTPISYAVFCLKKKKNTP